MVNYKASFTEVTATTIVDDVSAEIRRSISDGRLVAGEPFSIAAISAALQVSHIPVREALRRLEAEGLVKLRPSKGAVVQPMNRADVTGIYRIRRLLEPQLAAWSCLGLIDSDLARAESLLSVYLTKPPIESELRDHREFHLLLLRPAASEWDLRVLEYLWHANDRYVRILFDPDDSSRQDELFRSHTVLLDAARQRSPELLQQTLLQHLIDVESSIIAALEGTGPWQS